MSTPPQIAAILKWQRGHEGEIVYDDGRNSTQLASDTAHLTSPTDCSGMAIRMLRHFGGPAAQAELKGATYTGNLCRLGELITTHRADAAAGRGMSPGDLVFFTWNGHNPTFDHVAIYAGNGRIWNHGGPGRGPLNWSLRDNVNAASEVMVRRYPTSRPVTPTPAVPAKPASVIPSPTPLEVSDMAKIVCVDQNECKKKKLRWPGYFITNGLEIEYIATPARLAALRTLGLPVQKISIATYRGLGGK